MHRPVSENNALTTRTEKRENHEKRKVSLKMLLDRAPIPYCWIGSRVSPRRNRRRKLHAATRSVKFVVFSTSCIQPSMKSPVAVLNILLKTLFILSAPRATKKGVIERSTPQNCLGQASRASCGENPGRRYTGL